MSVRGMTDRAEIPAHRLLHSHHSNKPERAREGRMDEGRERERKGTMKSSVFEREN